MASSYPNSLDSLTTSHQDGVQEVIHATDVNNLADAVNKIEAELGTTPKGTYTDVDTRLNTLETVVFNNQTTTPYTLVLSDASKTIVCNLATAFSLVIPNNTSVAFPIGTVIAVRQGGVGQVTISGASGVTVVNPFISFVTAAQNAEVRLLKIATNTWSVNGEVV